MPFDAIPCRSAGSTDVLTVHTDPRLAAALGSESRTAHSLHGNFSCVFILLFRHQKRQSASWQKTYKNRLAVGMLNLTRDKNDRTINIAIVRIYHYIHQYIQVPAGIIAATCDHGLSRRPRSGGLILLELSCTDKLTIANI